MAAGALCLVAGKASLEQVRHVEQLIEEAKAYPKTKARVISVEIKMAEDVVERQHCISATYKFTVDDEEYESDFMAPAGVLCEMSDDEAYAARPELVVGNEIDVLYDPSNPETSWLEPVGDEAFLQEYRKNSTPLFGGGAALMLLGIGYGFTQRQKQ